MQSGIEQRKHRRFSLSLPVLVSPVRGKAKEARTIDASTKDISAQGIYLVLSQEVEIGSRLELEVTLPLGISGGKPVRIRCQAKIARVEPADSEGKIGVGARIDHYEFLRDEPDVAS